MVPIDDKTTHWEKFPDAYHETTTWWSKTKKIFPDDVSDPTAARSDSRFMPGEAASAMKAMKATTKTKTKAKGAASASKNNGAASAKAKPMRAVKTMKVSKMGANRRGKPGKKA